MTNEEALIEHVARAMCEADQPTMTASSMEAWANAMAALPVVRADQLPRHWATYRPEAIRLIGALRALGLLPTAHTDGEM